MTKPILKNKVLLVGVLLLAFTASYSGSVFAWESHGGGHGGGRGHYYYRGGRWYDRGWFWGNFAAGLAIGTIVATLPPYYDTVYANSGPYYYYDNIYYRPYPSGYIVVPAPAAANTVATAPVVMQPPVVSGETVVIKIPKSRGGNTLVTLTKYKTGYLGPQGEYYERLPSVDQLRLSYGYEYEGN